MELNRSIDRQLESFLKEISTGGSGDDITLGIASRIEQSNRQIDADRELEQTIKKGDELVEVNNIRKPKKTQKVNKSLQRKLITITPLFLAVASTCLSSYLFFKSEETNHRLENFIKNNQQKIVTLQKQINQIEAKQNENITDRQSAVKKKRRGGT